MYLIDYTSRIGTARVKQEEEAATRIIQESNKKSGRKECEHEEEKSKQDLTSAKEITIKVPERCESPYHRLD